MNVSIAREIERLERRLLVLATVGSAGPVRRPVRHGLGHHVELPVDRRLQEHLAGGSGAGHRGSAVATAIGLIAAIPATIFYNKFTSEVNRQAQRLEGLRGRIFGNPVAPDRRNGHDPERRKPVFGSDHAPGQTARGAYIGEAQHEYPIMAMNMAGSSGGGAAGRRRAVMAEINVTPMVDVMLVLLIIFMGRRRYSRSACRSTCRRPRPRALIRTRTRWTLSVNVKGEVFLNDTQIALNDLVPKLKSDHGSPRRAGTNGFLSGATRRSITVP